MELFVFTQLNVNQWNVPCRDTLNGQKGEIQKFGAMKENFDRKDVEYKKISAELREQVIELREANVSRKYNY